MIIKATIKASGYKAVITPKLLLHKGDTVFIELTLFNNMLTSVNGVDVEEMLPLNALSDVKLKLVTPNGVDIIENTEIIGNKAKFRLDVSEVVGVYKFQVVCYDGDGCVFHLPPCTYIISDTIR